MLIRSCEWAATGKVTYPFPDDFPTAAEMKLRANATVKKSEDQVIAVVRDGGTAFCVRSPRGIGSATIQREAWPDQVRLRLHLRGLEELTIRSDSMALKASVLSHSGHRRMLRVVNDGQEKDVEEGGPYWTEIKTFDSNGKQVQGWPGEGGYFEMLVPQRLLEAQPKSLDVDWIDFYRQ